MTLVTYTYKKDPEYHHVGFIAEDVSELVATPDRMGLSAMEIAAVLTRVVQEQQKMITALEAQVRELRDMIIIRSAAAE